MDDINRIKENDFRNISSRLPFNSILLTKDYYLTVILYLLRDVEGLYFKGGTALHKIFLNYARLSEDLDFTLTGDMGKTREKIKDILNKSRLFERVTKDKDVEGFTRLVVHYRGLSDEHGNVFIDLNKRAKLMMKPEKHEIKHFYQNNIPRFSFNTLAKEEMLAEKVIAAIRRNKPRDHYDIYRIIKAGIPIKIELVKKKCRLSGVEFNIIRMFSKAKKLKRRWDENMLPLLAEEVSFEEVMKTLAESFSLKREKERLREKKN